MRRPRLWFVVPAHGRIDLSRICLRQLRHTCDMLTDNGVLAEAVVIADDGNLATAKGLGFGWVKRDNRFLGRKFNDGIQLAMDSQFNPNPADYVVPCGSDDFVDWRLFTDLPHGRTMVGFQMMSFVREDGRELTGRKIAYNGGCGIRIYPRAVMATLRYRPCDEDRKQGCDTSILVNLSRIKGIRHVLHRPIDPLQLVDWKSPGEQINSYDTIENHHRAVLRGDPFELLTDRYPAEALASMERLYARRPRVSLVLA